MVTVTIKENSKQAKALIELLKGFSFVEFHDQEDKALLEMMEKSRKSGKANRKNVLKSLGINES